MRMRAMVVFLGCGLLKARFSAIANHKLDFLCMEIFIWCLLIIFLLWDDKSWVHSTYTVLYYLLTYAIYLWGKFES